jgi:hypothetical protein
MAASLIDGGRKQSMKASAFLVVASAGLLASCARIEAPTVPHSAPASRQQISLHDTRNGTSWHYLDHYDSFTQTTSKLAGVMSANEFELTFPYQGPQHGILYFEPRWNTNSNPKSMHASLELVIERGQFACLSDNCVVWLKFDDHASEMWYAHVDQYDPRSARISPMRYRETVNACAVYGLLTANNLTLRVEFLQQGNRDLEFEVAGLGKLPLSLPSGDSLKSYCAQDPGRVRAEADETPKGSG